jgi:septation ring formation regulator EzrA
MTELIAKGFEDGMALGFAIVISLLLLLLVNHILKQQKDILSMATKQNEQFVEAINRHTNQAEKFHEMVTEAHKYQRDEHKDMLKNQTEISSTLAKVCNGLDNVNKSFDRTNNSLDQVEKALGRINGYCKD